MRHMRFRDQHNRAWTTVVSVKTLEPCTVMTPQGWMAPLPMMVPPTKYFTFSPGDVGQTVINYDHWITDIANAEREYGVWVLQIAKKEFGSAALQKIESKDHGLRMLCGPPPQSSEFVKAMKAGNKWALGIPRGDGTTYPRPAWAEPHYDGWIFESTFDGGDVEVSAKASDYPDEDEDGAEIAARFAKASEYDDVEDAIDPKAAHGFQPLPRRGRGRPPKVKE